MPTKFQVSLGRKAERDIEEIWSFIAKDSSADATNLFGDWKSRLPHSNAFRRDVR